MNGRFLLDTNIVIAILEKDASVVRRLDPQMRLFLPCIVMGELFYGAYRSGRVKHNLERLTALAKALPVLPCETGTAAAYGQLKDELRKKGKPIPENDIWIAAISTHQNLTLITRDKHFTEIKSLSTDVW